MNCKSAYWFPMAALVAAILGFGALAPVTAMAADDARITRIQDDLQRLKREMNDLTGSGSGSSSIEDLRQTLADLNERVRQMEIDYQAMLGKIEEYDFRIKEMESRLEASTAASSGAAAVDAGELGELNRKVDMLTQNLTEISRRVDALSAPGSRVTPVAPVAPATPGSAAGTPAANPTELYDAAYSLYREGKYLDAQNKFREYIEKFPSTSLTDNAHFWIGEAFYDQRLYEQAILQYDKVVQNYPDGDKVASALLKQAFAFAALGDNASAKILLGKVIKEHGDSEQAAIARKKLEVLGD